MMPKLIAPDPCCDWCYTQMRDLTLTGQSLVTPGHVSGYAAQLIAATLHESKLHVHTSKRIGDGDYNAIADIALPLLPTPTVVMYDVDVNRSRHLMLTSDRTGADRRMHWADAVSQSMKFARVGWRVIRVREPGLEATSPLDIVLPRRIVQAGDNELLVRLAAQHIVGIIDANVAAA
jgi:hypothetical protein